MFHVFTIEERGRDLLAAAQRIAYKSSWVTRKADPYGRDTVWYKIKNPTYTQGAGQVGAIQKR